MPPLLFNKERKKIMTYEDIALNLTEKLAHLEDIDIRVLVKNLYRECDRRFIDFDDIIDEVQEEMEHEYMMEEMEEEQRGERALYSDAFDSMMDADMLGAMLANNFGAL